MSGLHEINALIRMVNPYLLMYSKVFTAEVSRNGSVCSFFEIFFKITMR
jgi:hypothetical protein